MAAKATRQSFGEAVARIAETNPQIVVMDADLGKSTMTGTFAKKFPDRYFEFGIAEQNMIGTAAGMAMAGKVPFLTSFSCFLMGRAETVRMSVAYLNANVKLVGTHAGIGIGEDGNSQMGLEDIALARSYPSLAVLQPGDDLEAQQAVEWAASYKGPVYFRLTRQKMPDVHGADYKFQFGKGDILKATKGPKPGAAVFVSGGPVANALQAVEAPGQDHAITLVNIHTVKPLDEALVLELARRHGKAVTIEDHNIVGGLGSAVAETLASAGSAAKLLRVGIHGWGESGSPEGLYEKYGLSAPKLQQTLKDFLSA